MLRKRQSRKKLIETGKHFLTLQAATDPLNEVLNRIEQGKTQANTHSTYTSLITACTHVSQLERLHHLITKNITCDNHSLRNHLLQAYIKCKAIDQARRVFQSCSQWDLLSWTCMLTANAKSGHHTEATSLLFRLQLEGIHPDKPAFIALLQVCKQLNLVILVHGWIHEAGFLSDTLLSNMLINMYSKCGSLDLACKTFESLRNRDKVSYNTMISSHVSSNVHQRAYVYFLQMQLEGVRPDCMTFMSVLLTCVSSIERDRLQLIHSCATEDILPDVILSTAVLNAFSRCGDLDGACSVFNSIGNHDQVSLNAMIAVYARFERTLDAFRVFEMFERLNLRRDKVTFLNILTAVLNREFLSQGRSIHEIVCSVGLETDIAVATAVIDMYGRCGELREARRIFDRLGNKDIVAWNSMLTGYAKHDRIEETKELFQKMEDYVSPNRVSFLAVLHACDDLELGGRIYSRISMEIDGLLGNSLIQMYARCGDLEAASRVFSQVNEMNRDPSPWNAMVAAFTQYGHLEEAISLVHKMHQGGVEFDEISFVTVLNACSGQRQGDIVHQCAAEAGMQRNAIVRTAVLNMYGKCGNLQKAYEIFQAFKDRDLVSWNAMTSAYLQHERYQDVLNLFKLMHLEGVKPDQVSYLNSVQACGCLEEINRIEELVISSGFVNEKVINTALVSMYGSYEALDLAEKVFQRSPNKDTIMWNAMIYAYGASEKAVEVYRRMDMPPDKLTLTLVLNACAGLADGITGKVVYSRAVELRFHTDLGVISAAVNMYAKCGDLNEAEVMFDSVRERTVFMWNSMVSGYAQRGHIEKAFLVFSRMQQDGCRADSISFVSVLGMCSHAGMVTKGCEFFESLVNDYGIVPYREHYACVVDMFGRAGKMEEAEECIERIPKDLRSVSVWGTLLGASAIHNDPRRGRRAAGELFHIKSRKSSPYVIMANLCQLND